ncbi:MAG: 3-deoxy-manno-octulosonate cytidylyltransferase [Gammaproteobacteria bacterium]|nr:3-deoxy-manno-octulosonate cytidylyltransferase [Gammaproteobacteria bacterium]
MKFKVVVPARLGSTRLPRKVLREIHGRPLVQYAFEAALKTGAEQVIVATDDDAVAAACRRFGAEVAMTSIKHNSGTDRIDEVARACGWPADVIVVNLQGDEPLMPPELVRQAAELLARDPQADVATLCHPIDAAEEWLNPNFVKVVMDARGYALYFSRAPIPWKREGSARMQPAFPQGLAYRHIGLYAYRVAALARFSRLPPAPLEECEALEQLRALFNGLRIKVGITHGPPPRGVDTEEDLIEAGKLLAA